MKSPRTPQCGPLLPGGDERCSLSSVSGIYNGKNSPWPLLAVDRDAMIDVHHHLLYGLDDGAETIEDSIAMAKMAVEDGITHVVCTPHASHRYKFRQEENAVRLASLRAELASRGVPLVLGQGCDLHLSWDNIQDAKANPAKYSINGKQYILVELPDQFIPAGLSDTFIDLQSAGLMPIVTHPERNPAVQRDPSKMKAWLEEGVLVQVTAGAVLGRFGSKAQALSHRFLENRWVHIIATDAHNTSSRPPKMREAFELIGKTFGHDTAHRLCVSTPLDVFEGKVLGPQPRPAGLEDDGRPMEKKSLLGRFFGR